ncbi:MAG: 50S ribosomal protein L3 [bacterium]|nr:50S ribosomal protein L3 [bacterium]
MKFILGEKFEMSQVFDKEGNVTPVTLVKASPNTVLQIKVKEKDGYEAVQIGFGKRSKKNIKKPQGGHFKDLANFQYVREFRTANQEPNLKRGDVVDVAVFKEGDTVKVSGISKAKGFQGVVKRYNFAGAPATHGTKHAHRQPGGIGGAGGRAGGRVAKGMRMAGRMGGERVSVKNLKIVKVDAENNMLAISGAVPGRRGTLLEIRN